MATNVNTTFSADDDEVAQQIAEQVLSEAGFATRRELARTPPQGDRRARLAASLTPPSAFHRPPVTTTTGPSSLPTLPSIPEGSEEQKGEKSKRSTDAAQANEGEGGQYSYAPPPKAPPVSLAKVFEQAMAGVLGGQGIEPSTSTATDVWEATRRTPMPRTTHVSFAPPATSAFRPITTTAAGTRAPSVPPSPPTVTVYPPLGGAYAQGLATLLGNGHSAHTAAPPQSTSFPPPSQPYFVGGPYGPPITPAPIFTHAAPTTHSSSFPPQQGYPAQFPPPPTAPYYPPTSSYHAPNPPLYYQQR